MSSLTPPFILCPLTETKGLLGISEDKMENKIIMTIGKNIAIRYFIQDQKQEISWTCSRHWFTSKVIYSHDLEKYGAVIDNCIVVLFDENDTVLSQMTKLKFPEPIYQLFPTLNRGTLIVFKNGNIFSLKKAIKDKNLFSPTEKILSSEDRILGTEIGGEEENFLFLFTTQDKIVSKIKCGHEKLKTLKVTAVIIPQENEIKEKDSVNILHFQIEIGFPDEKEIIGYCILKHERNNILIYLASDGFIYKKKMNSVSSSEEEGKRIGNLNKFVKSTLPVIIRPLHGSPNVLIYGCDPAEEGAVVFIYDTNFDLLISKQSLKLYANPPIMEKVWDSALVPLGQNFLVLGVRSKKALLSSVVAKHPIQNMDIFEAKDPWADGWEEDNRVNIKDDDLDECKFPGFLKIVKTVKILENSGQPESMICSQIVPDILQLPNSSSALEWLLDYFLDISDQQIIAILGHLLSKNSEDANSQISKILKRNFDASLLIKCVRSLDYLCVKKLLTFLLNNLMSTSWVYLDSQSEDSLFVLNSLKWIGILLDAHFAQLVHNEELEIINQLLNLVQNKSEIMRDIFELEPLLKMTLEKIKFEPEKTSKQKYRTEIVTFE